MSNLSTYPTPFQVVLKPGLYQSQNTKGGLNLNKWLLKFLKRIGFADTVDCCVYYPTFPTVIVVNAGAPTEEEMDNANIPIKGIFITQDENGVWYMGVRCGANCFDSFATND